MVSWLNSEQVVQSGGLLAIGLMVFAESGLLIGLFFPGDTLLITAGFFAAQHKLPLVWLLVVVFLAAVIGYEVGYRFGEKLGPKMFKRNEGILFKKEYINRTKDYFERYGKATIVVARFIAHVRTFVSLIAGAGKMDKRTFFIYNVVGALLWGVGVTMLGYGVGSAIPNFDKYLVPTLLIGLVVAYSVVLWGILKSPSRRGSLWTGLKSDLRYVFSRKKA